METKHTILAAFYKTLLPVISMMLRAGVTWKEFAELGKTAFVEVATERYGLRGRNTNVSRVSILTGLSRHEVRRQRNRLARPAPVAQSTVGNAARVLSGWHQDADFLGQDGRPRELAVACEASGFRALARRHAGDIPPVALLKELVRAGSVEQLPGNVVRVLSRSFSPQSSDPQALLRASDVLRDLACNADYNLGRKRGTPARFEGRATLDGLPAATAQQFSAFMEREGQALLERADDWLAQARNSHHESTPAGTARMGLGIYLIEEQHD